MKTTTESPSVAGLYPGAKLSAIEVGPSRYFDFAGRTFDIDRTAVAKLPQGKKEIVARLEALHRWANEDCSRAWDALGKFLQTHKYSSLRDWLASEYQMLRRAADDAERAAKRAQNRWSNYATYWVIRTWDDKLDGWRVNPRFGIGAGPLPKAGKAVAS